MFSCFKAPLFLYHKCWDNKRKYWWTLPSYSPVAQSDKQSLQLQHPSWKQQGMVSIFLLGAPRHWLQKWPLELQKTELTDLSPRMSSGMLSLWVFPQTSLDGTHSSLYATPQYQECLHLNVASCKIYYRWIIYHINMPKWNGNKLKGFVNEKNDLSWYYFVLEPLKSVTEQLEQII